MTLPTIAAVPTSVVTEPLGPGSTWLRPMNQESMPGPLRAADAAWSERAHVGVELLERAGERFDVGVGERAGEVLCDPVVVLAAGACHRLAAFVGLDDED